MPPMSNGAPDTTHVYQKVERSSSAWTIAVLALVLLLSSPLLVLGTFGAPWFQAKDSGVLSENPLVRDGWSPEALLQVARPASAEAGLPYGPLTYFTLALQHAVHGPLPWAFRLANLLLHLGAALVLYRVILALLPYIPKISIAQDPMNADSGFPACGAKAAVFGAALYFLHPLNVEALPWVSARAGIQASLLALLAWWGLLSGGPHLLAEARLRPPSGGVFTLALWAYLAALGSHPSAAGFAVLFVLTESLLIQGPVLGRAIRMFCFALPALLTVGLVHAGSAGTGPGRAAALAGRALLGLLAPGCGGELAAAEANSGFTDAQVGLALLLLFMLFLACLWFPVERRPLGVLLAGSVAVLGAALWAREQPLALETRDVYPILAPTAVGLALAADALHYRLRFFREPMNRTLGRAGFVMGGLACVSLAGLSLCRSLGFNPADAPPGDAAGENRSTDPP